MQTIPEYIVTAIGWATMGGLLSYLLFLSNSHTREIQAREDGYHLGLLESADSTSGCVITYKPRPFDWSID